MMPLAMPPSNRPVCPYRWFQTSNDDSRSITPFHYPGRPSISHHALHSCPPSSPISLFDVPCHLVRSRQSIVTISARVHKSP